MAGPDNPVSEREAIGAMESLLIDLERRPGVRHVALGASDLEGAWQWSGSAGVADASGRTMSVETPWFLASVTKLYIATVVLRLVEDGLIDLESPISRYLPEQLASEIHVLKGEDQTPKLTSVHLLGHFSGLADWLDEPPPRGRSWIEALLAGQDRSWNIEEAVIHARDALRPHFRPSDTAARRPRVRYSDTNFQLLMLIAEQAGEAEMGTLFERYVTGPLRLAHTGLYNEFPTEGDRAPASPWFGRRSLRSFPLALQSTGDLFGTTDDLLAYGRALFTGQIFERPETFQLMTGHFHRFGLPRGVAGYRAPSWPIEYGLGIMRFKVSRLPAGGRRIPTLIGHTGATGSWLWYAPDLGLVCAGTVDQSDHAPLPFRQVPRALAKLA